MSKLLHVLAAAALLGSSTISYAADTKVGILMDITGPIASFIPPLQNATNLAIKHVNEQGGLLDGKAVAVYGDTTGSSQGAVDAAGKLINIENVPIIVGALMSGTTIAAAEAAAIPAGVVQISPTATSPALSAIKDNDLLFRIVPSDNYQGTILAKMVLQEGIKKVAVTYVNNDYGVGIGQTFIDALPATVAGFDCVYANQVFEHLPDPLQTLVDLCRQLKPEGIVCLRVPDGRGVATRLEQRGWSPELEAIHPLEHINCFTRKTLTGLASKAGLKPFYPPLRLSWGSLWDGIRREIADRLLTTHLFLRRQ